MSSIEQIIPSDWKIQSLGDVCIKVQDGNYGAFYPKSSEFIDYGVPFLTSKVLGKTGKIDKNKIDFISAEKHQQLKKAHLNLHDVLFTNRGASVGAIGFVDESIANGNIGPQLTLLRASEDIKPTYLYHIMKSFWVKNQIQGQDSGSAMNFFGIGTTLKFRFPTPNLKEQTAIANALSDVDALLTELEKLIAKRQAIKTATMQQLLTGKTRLPQFATYTEGEKQGVPEGKSKGTKPSELGEIPEDWDVQELKQLTTTHNAGIYKNKSEYGSGINIAGVGDIYNISKIDGQIFRRVPLNESEKKQYLLQEGDLVYGESSLVREGIARTVYVDRQGEGTAFAWHTRRYKVNTDKVNPIYLYYYLAGSAGRSHMISNSITTALTGINTEAYFSCPIKLPNIQEQTAIATILSDMDNEIQTLEQRLAKTRQIKQGMMQELLTGRTRLPFEKE
ncbi:restriction endonuclease subunit S [Pseudoalteromonas gelatinilytica]